MAKLIKIWKTIMNINNVVALFPKEDFDIKNWNSEETINALPFIIFEKTKLNIKDEGELKEIISYLDLFPGQFFKMSNWVYINVDYIDKVSLSEYAPRLKSKVRGNFHWFLKMSIENRDLQFVSQEYYKEIVWENVQEFWYLTEEDLEKLSNHIYTKELHNLI